MTKRHLLTLVATACVISTACGQTAAIEYTGELQTNFDGKYNFVNLLHLSLDKKIGKAVNLSLSTISTVKTGDHIIDDLQGFSNIEADNLPLAIAVAGITWSINENNSLFAGIRRVDEDYFTSDVTGLFTNASCGIYPTLSCNYPVATFPDAAIGLHYRHEAQRWAAQASVYNGTGHHRFTGSDNAFRVCPSSDGVLTMVQGEYHGSHGDYFAGAAMHYGRVDEVARRQARTALWAYGEQHVTSVLSLIVGYSHAFNHDSQCSDFAGLGATWQHNKITAGIFSDYARFDKGNEWATEVTCKYQLNDNLALQPAFHYVHNSDNKVAALLRVVMNL